MTFEERAESMVRMYGEVCTKAAAARILNCSPSTICSMVKDGRLDTACEGTRIDVHSIARYIINPKKEDFEARKRRLMIRNKTQWIV